MSYAKGENVMQEQQKPKRAHNVIMENRRTIFVSGVEDVDSFDESAVVVFTDCGILTVHGADLHINRLSVENGELNVEGEIHSVSYSDDGPRQGGGFFSKIFR